MLRFQRDQLFVGVSPRHVSLVRTAGTWRQTITQAEVFSLPEGGLGPFLQQTLAGELQGPLWRRTEVRVVLADTLVRYFIAPVPRGARNLRELRDAAALRFDEIFGNDTRDWTVAVDLAPGTSQHLGCAIRTHLAETLRRCCREAHLSLKSIAPFGVSEFNRCHRRIGPRSGWIVAFGIDAVWAAYKFGGGWSAVQVQPRDQNSVAKLPEWLNYIQLRTGIATPASGNIWLTGFGNDRSIALPEATRGQWLDAQDWPDQNESWSEMYRLALSPVWPSCA